ncbi:MAG TPA: glycoside hydrolase family 18 protein, partial [Fibrobacteraceae bacterium]|nr:glycoside hydrolase family 18 protein [Fibrobacteraceae bacterium]
ERSFDGVDLDWEYSDTPSEDDTAAYSALVREIRDSVGLGYSFSLALPSGPYYGKWFSVEGFIEAIDWIGVMTYDLTGDWDESAGYNSALYPHEGITSWSWEESMDYWTGRGIAKEKLYPGIASFGFLFTTCVGPGQDFSGDVEYLTYAQILDSSSWNLYWDDTSKVPYALTPTGGYATFDNAASIALKLHWVIDNGYPGVILWELSQDYLEEGGHPILDSLATIRAEATAIQISTGTAASKIHRNGQTFWIETYGMEPSSLSLYQLNGHLLRQVRGSSGLLRLDLRNIPEGPYFVVLRRGAHLIDHQFAINPD